MRLAWVGALLATGLALGARADGCAEVYPGGFGAPPVSVLDEHALITWNAVTKRESFYRRATFRSDVHDFGFLVPVPSLPKVVEGADLFRDLARETAPKPVWSDGWSRSSTTIAPSDVLDKPKVTVLSEERVAGFDVTVLEANSAEALAGWLAKHGYATRPSLAEWLGPLVAKNWKLVAFKLAPTDAVPKGELVTRVVRITFDSEKPFYPYREPRDQLEHASGARTLKLWLIADRKLEGRIGEGGPLWPGTPLYASSASDFGERMFGPDEVRKGSWLHAFVDESSPRPGTDEVYFEPAADQTPIEPVILMDRYRNAPAYVCLGVTVLVLGVAVRPMFRRRPTPPPG